MKLLNQINSPSDLRKLKVEQLADLAIDLRQFIIDIVSVKEGHLGASLGVVELTLALHYVFNTPEDILIWDVGHQAYGHKIITERKSVFETNRQFGGISGFPRISESKYDAFGTGHSSTSISAILGMAIASKIKGDIQKQHIAVIGDASIASGMAFEGLNHAGVSNTNILIILNDNAIGIDPSVGALKKYLTTVKKGIAKEENIFECLNFDYSGPIDGHNILGLIRELERLKKKSGPKLLHISTTKGKGLKKAEENQVVYHAPGKFNKTTGDLETEKLTKLPPKYQDVFGKTIVELAENNKRIIGITPAMPSGSSLTYMMQRFPERAFDVGIAEQHAVTLAAGMATKDLLPFCVIYSTFLQRAYDQIIHDVCLQDLSVILLIDRAGLVGQDGPTHHGVFDIAYLRCIPNLIVFAPGNEEDLRNIMYTAQEVALGPIAIRYPRGRGTSLEWQKPFKMIKIGKGQELRKGSLLAILTIGPFGQSIMSQIDKVDPKMRVGIYNMRFVKPLDKDLLDFIFLNYKEIITIEDSCKLGGFGSAVLEYKNTAATQIPITVLGIEDGFVEHGPIEDLYKATALDNQSILQLITKKLSEI